LEPNPAPALDPLEAQDKLAAKIRGQIKVPQIPTPDNMDWYHPVTPQIPDQPDQQ
jgi:hypothetical protein